MTLLNLLLSSGTQAATCTAPGLGEPEILTRNRSRWGGHYGWGTQREPERKEGFPGHKSRVHRAERASRKALDEDHSHGEKAVTHRQIGGRMRWGQMQVWRQDEVGRDARLHVPAGS